MKKILYSVLFLFLVSCNTKQSETLKWTEEEKDLTYKESNSYCQCTIDVLTANFENNDDAREKIGEDKSLRLLFKSCEN